MILMEGSLKISLKSKRGASRIEDSSKSRFPLNFGKFWTK